MKTRQKWTWLVGLLSCICCFTFLFTSCAKEKEESQTTTYTVVFFSDDGLTILGTPQVVEENGVLNVETPPDREGYNFIGWLYNGEVYDFTADGAKSVTQDMKFEAKYAKKTFTVGFYDEDGETQIGELQTIQYKKSFLPYVAFDKPGYYFIGWRLDGSEDLYDFTALNATVVTDDLKFIAVYEQGEYVTETGGDSYANDLPEW